MYMGIPILVSGLLGETLNTIVFLSLETFRQSSCAFYLTVMSFVNIGQLLTSLFPRIMTNGFGVDWTETSSFYCKFRIYILQFSALMSCTCMCLATVDQFFETSSNARWQRLRHIRIARILCFAFAVLWSCQGIPYLFYLNLVPLPGTRELFCNFTSYFLLQYFNYVCIIVLVGLVPVVITLVFAWLAYENIQQSTHRTVPLVRRALDKQLTMMVLFQVMYDCVTTLPYIVLFIIMRDPTIAHDPLRNEQFKLASALLVNLYYLHYAVRIDRSFVWERWNSF